MYGDVNPFASSIPVKRACSSNDPRSPPRRPRLSSPPLLADVDDVVRSSSIGGKFILVRIGPIDIMSVGGTVLGDVTRGDVSHGQVRFNR